MEVFDRILDFAFNFVDFILRTLFFHFADGFTNLKHWLKGQAIIKKGLRMAYPVCTVFLSRFLGCFSNSKAEIVISTKAISFDISFDL